jgi:formate hydrogenlyase transcriptional activator
MGISIAQARNRGGITASNAQVEILLAINREIHSSLSVNSLLQLLVEKAVVGVGFERGLIYLIEGDFLRCRAFLDRVKKEKASVILKRVGFRMEEQAIETLAVRLGRSFHIRDARNDSRVSKKLLRVADVSEYCVVPITGRREVLGVFTGDKYYSKAPILPEELKFLELFAGQVGLALENAKLYEEKDCLNEILRQRVSERTEELCRANRMLETRGSSRHLPIFGGKFKDRRDVKQNIAYDRTAWAQYVRSLRNGQGWLASYSVCWP